MTNIKKMEFFDVTTGEPISRDRYGIDGKIFKRVDNVHMIFDSRGQYLGIRICRGKFINGKFTGKKGIYDFRSFLELKEWENVTCSILQKADQEIVDIIEKENIDEMEKAHKHSINHKSIILKDKKCGCFYCLAIFSPTEITEWIEDKIDGTAICPHCGIDSIIGESSGFPITEEFLLKMNRYWF